MTTGDIMIRKCNLDGSFSATPLKSLSSEDLFHQTYENCQSFLGNQGTKTLVVR